MEPQEIKAKIQAAYAQALAQSNTQWSRDERFSHIFRDVKLYGRDAGCDFVATHMGAIVQGLIETAQTRAASATLTPYGFGNSALDGMAFTLRELTGLKVDRINQIITVAWADANPRLI